MVKEDSMKSKLLTLILFASTAALAQSQGQGPSASDKRLESDSVQGGIVRDVDGRMMDDNSARDTKATETQDQLSAPSSGIDDSRDDTKQGVSDVATPKLSPPITDQNKVNQNRVDQNQINTDKSDTD